MATMIVNFFSCPQDKKYINKTLTRIIATPNSGYILYKSADLRFISFRYKASTRQTRQSIINNAQFVTIAPIVGTYAITNITLENEDYILIECEKDLIETYKNMILAATATVTQSENGNKYLNNVSTNYDIRPKFKKLNFSENTAFSNIENNIVLITTKGNI